MAVKTITIKEKIYDKLARIKRENESFSDLFDRLAERENPDLMVFAGILSDKTAKEIKKSIKKSRKRSQARMKMMRAQLNDSRNYIRN